MGASTDMEVTVKNTRLEVAIVILVAIILLCVSVVGKALADEPSASPSPSPSSSVSPSPSATPAPAVVRAPATTVKWARHWRRIAVREWRTWNRARACLGMHKRPFAGPQPPRSASKAVWTAAGRAWKHRVRPGGVRTYQSRTRALVRRMTHPKGSGWERWRPLVRWIWPARCVNTVVRIIRYESGGNPRILNGGYVLPKWAGDGKPVNRAGGLTQCLPAPRHWADPFFNLMYAFKHKYLPALRQYGNGWLPWARCRAF